MTIFGENDTSSSLILDGPKYGMIRDWSGRDDRLTDGTQMPINLNTLKYIDGGNQEGYFEASMDLAMNLKDKELNKISFKLEKPIWEDVICKVLVESNDIIMALSQDHGSIHSGW